MHTYHISTYCIIYKNIYTRPFKYPSYHRDLSTIHAITHIKYYATHVHIPHHTLALHRHTHFIPVTPHRHTTCTTSMHLLHTYEPQMCMCAHIIKSIKAPSNSSFQMSFILSASFHYWCPGCSHRCLFWPEISSSFPLNVIEIVLNDRGWDRS